jgi:CYTH domain-containing protein
MTRTLKSGNKDLKRKDYEYILKWNKTKHTLSELIWGMGNYLPILER